MRRCIEKANSRRATFLYVCALCCLVSIVPFRMAAAVVQAPQPECNSEASAVRALVDCIKKEETVVTVNLDERIQVSLTVHCNCGLSLTRFPLHYKAITLRGLPSSCYPEAKPANALASMKAKEQKAKVAKPFPLISLADFLPSSMEDSNIYFAHTASLCTICTCRIRQSKMRMVMDKGSSTRSGWT